MIEKRHSPLDRVLGQLDHLDETNLQNLINRLAREQFTDRMGEIGPASEVM